MNIKELLKDLDPVTIIEFKNYLVENLSNLYSKKTLILRLFQILKLENFIVKSAGVNFIEMVKLKLVFKNIFELVVS